MRYFIYCRKSTDAEDRQVLSLDSQLSELSKLIAGKPSIEIVAILQEKQSAKAPGRPVFNEMLERIEAGEAEGIIAWQPDRLARNSLDGGRVIYFLDLGLLKDLQFSMYTFENTPHGKMMLGMIFTISKLYVDNLSANVKTGNRTKAALGWRPTRPPLGYMTDPNTKTTVRDPERFASVQQVFRLMLSGIHTARSIHRIVTEQWGLRTPQRKRVGGALVQLSAINKILRNQFYAGIFVWEGTTIVGKHEPMLTIDEFERVQALSRRPALPRPKVKSFPFIGLLRCGACGLPITAEDKINRHGSAYTYYHCTRSKYSTPCREPYVRKELLTQQIEEFLEALSLPLRTTEWLRRMLAESGQERSLERTSQRAALEASIRSIERELSTLTDLRVRELISDEEFISRRVMLTRTRLSGLQRLESQVSETDWTLILRTLITFSNRAAELFSIGNDDDKRLILRTTASNPLLTQRIFSSEARKPFVQVGQRPSKTQLLAFVNDVRTLSDAKDENFLTMLADIETILDRADRSEAARAA